MLHNDFHLINRLEQSLPRPPLQKRPEQKTPEQEENERIRALYDANAVLTQSHYSSNHSQIPYLSTQGDLDTFNVQSESTDISAGTPDCDFFDALTSPRYDNYSQIASTLRKIEWIESNSGITTHSSNVFSVGDEPNHSMEDAPNHPPLPTTKWQTIKSKALQILRSHEPHYTKEDLVIPLGGGTFGRVYTTKDGNVIKIPIGYTKDTKLIPPDYTDRSHYAKELTKQSIDSYANEIEVTGLLKKGLKKYTHTGTQAPQKPCTIEIDGRTCSALVTKLYPFSNLRTYMKINHPISDRANIAYDLVKGLIQLRKQRIVHWDIKRENCYIGLKHAVIGDFGSAQRFEECTTPRATTHLPQAVKELKNGCYTGNRYVGESKWLLAGLDSDVFCMGLTLFYAFADGTLISTLNHDEEPNEDGVRKKLFYTFLVNTIPCRDPRIRRLIFKMMTNYQEVTDADLYILAGLLNRLRLRTLR